MPVIKFDYIAQPHIDDKTLVAVYRPIISIRLGANHKLYPFGLNCLLDSGADFNLLPAAIGERLGLKIKKGRKVTHMGIGNIGIVAYEHPVTIYVGSYHFSTKAHFSYDQKVQLIGRYGFFNKFKKVIFNEKDLQLELEY